MLSKRKFENLVTNGDFTFYGNKKFADQLSIPVKVHLENSSVSQAAIISNSGWINDLTTNITQNSIIQSTGWITDNITNLENTIYDAAYNVYNVCLSKESAANLYATKVNPTFTGTVTLPNNQTITSTTTSFLSSVDLSAYAPLASPTFTGTVTFPESSISQDAIGWGAETGWFTTFANEIVDLLNEKAPKASPTFTGTVTFPDASTITDYLKTSTAASTYAPITDPTLFGTVTFNAQGTTIADYLKTSTAASTYAATM